MAVTIDTFPAKRSQESAVAGMAGLILRKFRVLLLVLLIGWPLLALSNHIRFAGEAIQGMPDIMMTIVLPCLALFCPVVLFAEIDPYLFTRPISNKMLAGWHMLCGAISIALVWVLNVELIWRPRGFDVPLWWPAVILACALSCAQIVRWMPFKSGYLQAVMFCSVPGITGWAAYLAFAAGVTPNMVTIGGIALCLAAYPFAVHSLAHTRRGDRLGWPAHPLAAQRPVAASTKKRPFKNPLTAQIWLEFRSHGLLLAGSLAILACLTLPVLCFDLTEPVTLIAIFSGNTISVEANIWANALPLIAFIGSIYLALVIGCTDIGLRKPDRSLNSLFATRPLNSATLTAAKIYTAALSTIAVPLAMLPFMAVWMLVPAHSHGTTRLLGSYLAECFSQHMASDDKLILLAAFIFFLVLMWKLQTDTLYVHLTGRGWAGWVVFGMCMGPVLPFILGTGIQHDANIRQIVLNALPYAACTKLAVTVVFMARLHSNFVPLKASAKIAVIWISTALFLTKAFIMLLPPIAVPASIIASIVVLAMPGFRMALAPLALKYDRHR